MRFFSFLKKGKFYIVDFSTDTAGESKKMAYFITFLRERLYKGSEYKVLKPYSEVHKCLLFVSLLAWVPNIILFIQMVIKSGMSRVISSNFLLAYLIIFPTIELVLFAIFEGQYVKITYDEIKVVELVFVAKKMKISDIIKNEFTSKEIGLRLVSNDDEILVRTFNYSQKDVDFLLKKLGIEEKTALE